MPVESEQMTPNTINIHITETFEMSPLNLILCLYFETAE